MTNNYSYVAVAFLLPQPIASQVVKLSKVLSDKYSSWYELDIDIFPPHMTLWIAYVPSNNLSFLVENALNIFKNNNTLNVRLGPPEIESEGYISIPVDLSTELFKLHRNLLADLNRFREGYIPEKYIDKMESFPIDQRESIKKYGTRFAGNIYKPHISVGFIREIDIPKVRPYLTQVVTGEFYELSEITVFRQAVKGKSIEVLGSLSLA